MPEWTIPSRTIPAGLLVTAKSFLADRIRPDCEIVALQEAQMPGGKIGLRLGAVSARPPRPKRGGKLRAIVGPGPAGAARRAADDRWIIDLRDHTPANWAHFLNNHLPLLFGVAELAELDPAAALAILPADIPDHVIGAARLFGVEPLATDDVVEGRGVEVSLTPWIALRPVRAEWVRLPAPQAALDRIMAAPAARELPRKIFITRRHTRTLANEPEIEALLSARGFATVLPETLAPADQIRLFLQAEEIVAVHGAALAPLLYCRPGRGPRRLLEILPCGHMTNVYRAMAAQVGCDWIGVRGRIKPEYVRHIYDFDQKPYVAHSLDDFEADPASIERAFEILAERNGADRHG